MPLWILHATGAPLGLAPLLMVINNVVVVACQVPLSRFGATPPAARRLLRPLAAVFLVGCLALSASALVGPALAVVALVVATLGLTAAEMLHAVLSWELSVALSPPAAQGAYLGVHGLATSVQRSAGPLALTGVVAAGPLAWPLVGAVLIATCWAQNLLVRRRLGAEPDAAAPPLVAAGG
ncbi:hypothetical protein ACFV3R_24190 [Streptomyces sp. NPDC059740]|uniref:hypothetical protein n=1 Tax=Streptomyces sp. NPDC059740 TaxID=3346926 RepID=UPI003662D3DE